MKRTCTLLLLIPALLATIAWSQDKTANGSIIVVTVDGLNCSTTAGSASFNAQAWSFGATDTLEIGGTGSGAGTGKATTSNLVVQKMFDECSPLLFFDVTSGKVIKSVTLTQSDKKDRPVMTVKLTNAILVSYQLSGTQAIVDPMESISFAFEKICINNIASGSQACFNAATNTTQ
jgi:type VI protein secretion system component Hcp